MARLEAVGDIIGKEVITKDGVDMGQVKNLSVDFESWRVVELVVKLERDVLERLNLKRPMIGTQDIVVSSADVSGVADKVVLSQPLEVYAREAPQAEPVDASSEDDDD